VTIGRKDQGMNERRFDLIAAGGVDIDLVMDVERLPGHGEKVMGSFVGRLPGGTVANFACAAARLGLRVASLSSVGSDEAGQQVVDDFENYGVTSEFVLVREDVETHFTVILIEPSGERSIIVVPMFEERYDDEYLQQVIPQARAFYTMPNDGALFLRMARIARASGVMTMIDVESTVGLDRGALEALLPWVDIASFNEAGIRSIAGEAATIEGARRLLEYGPQMVVVTLGPRGAMAVTADEAVQQPGMKTTVRDTTGAGDTFNAAFLTATLRGDPLQQRLAYANAAAALAVSGLGPRGRLPAHDEVEAFMTAGATHAADQGTLKA
jgi:sugar/nucleoside kinase (ribokinase family)